MAEPRSDLTVTVRSTPTLRCAFCHDDSNATELLACASCGSRWHRDCGRRCPTLGCVARRPGPSGSEVGGPGPSGSEVGPGSDPSRAPAAFALRPENAELVAGRAQRAGSLATSARETARGFLIVTLFTAFLTLAVGVGALVSWAGQRDLVAHAVSTKGTVTTSVARRQGKNRVPVLEYEFRRDGRTYSHEAVVGDDFASQHPRGSTVNVVHSSVDPSGVAEIEGQLDTRADRTSVLAMVTLIGSVMLVGVALGAAVTSRRARRLERDGTLRPGRVLSCERVLDRGGFGVHLRYEIDREDGRTTRHDVRRYRPDLRGSALPAAGTPLVALVAGSDHELL